MHGDEARNALSLLVHAAHDVAGRFRGDEHRVDAGVRCDEAEVHVEAVTEDERVAVADDFGQALGPHALLGSVGREHHDDVGLVRSVVGVEDPKALFLGDGARG